jgi:16S rRNA (adenine1518-N6/adenine1519-N6)-dimethyltransferase
MTQSLLPLKKYGQNFLQNRHYAEKIVAALNLQPADVVLEIGAGTGAITEILQRQTCKKIVALEIDARCIQLLREKLGPPVEIVPESILNYAIDQLALAQAPARKVKVVGNIPYNITSDILFRLLEYRDYIAQLVIMVQQEVAERLLASPHNKEYGIPTVIIGNYAQIDRLFRVSRRNYFPVPRVDSTVLNFTFKTAYSELSDHDLFRQVVRQCFQTRRKKIYNNLRRFLEQEKVRQIKSISLDVRAEDLTIEEYVRLTNEIYMLNS